MWQRCQEDETNRAACGGRIVAASDASSSIERILHQALWRIMQSVEETPVTFGAEAALFSFSCVPLW